jgi:hypothetical protein
MLARIKVAGYEELFAGCTGQRFEHLNGKSLGPRNTIDEASLEVIHVRRVAAESARQEAAQRIEFASSRPTLSG